MKGSTDLIKNALKLYQMAEARIRQGKSLAGDRYLDTLQERDKDIPQGPNKSDTIYREYGSNEQLVKSLMKSNVPNWLMDLAHAASGTGRIVGKHQVRIAGQKNDVN